MPSARLPLPLLYSSTSRSLAMAPVAPDKVSVRLGDSRSSLECLESMIFHLCIDLQISLEIEFLFVLRRLPCSSSKILQGWFSARWLATYSSLVDHGESSQIVVPWHPARDLKLWNIVPFHDANSQIGGQTAINTASSNILAELALSSVKNTHHLNLLQ